MTDARPSPEAMLARAAEEERRARRGRLKIFFGAAPGVGKTYAMLEAAQALRRRGLAPLIGWIETHGRPETAALMDGLEQLPPREIEYRGMQLQEFDLDAAIARRPPLLLVDELAHTNAPGSRHARRWQDVEELRDKGIDVWGTLNVQHVESLNDVVAGITGVVVRETVPDSFLDGADEVELVDLPPDDLLRRLSEGKVYVPEQARRAMENFFRKGHLIGLRELALRRTAERVDEQAQEWRREHGYDRAWPTGERVLVAVGPAPQSANLVRAACRMAARLRAPWLAMTVEGAAFDRMPQAERDRVSEHMALADRLGAETIVVRGEGVADEILNVARQRNVSRIVVGKPTHPRWRDSLRGSLVEALIRGSAGIDILVTTGEPAAAPSVPRPPRRAPPFVEYVWAIAVVAACTAACTLAGDTLDLADQAMVHLLGVLLAASRLSRGPALLAAVASVAALDFFFVPPFHTFHVADTRYLVTFLVMMVVAVTVSSLTLRVRGQAQAARQRERRTAALYAMSREFAAAARVDDIARAAARCARELLECDALVLVADDRGDLQSRGEEGSSLGADERERAVARWASEHAQEAGRGTQTLPGAQGFYLPLVGTRRTLGVLGVNLAQRREPPAPSQRQLLETYVAQTALALDRSLLVEEAAQATLAAERELTRSGLLSAVSHDLRTPLASIQGSATALLEEAGHLEPDARRELLETIRDESARLGRLVGDLLDLTRLESGEPRVRKEWHSVEELVGSALSRLEEPLRGREVRIDLPDEVLLVPADPLLAEQVLWNLLENAAKHTPPGTPVEVAARRVEGGVEMVVADRGPGIPPGEEQRIFEKFYRTADGRRAAGAGLGLAICHAAARAHGGWIRAENRPGGGARFVLFLPAGEPPPRDPEADS
jgi:two-component system sensor histidine kinase KdpD